LDRQDAPDLWSEATVRAETAPARSGWLPRFAGGLAVAGVVVAGVVIGLQVAGQPTPGGPMPSPSDGGVVSATVVDGDYQLTITSLWGTWGTGEPIAVWATLEYLGADEEATLWGTGSGLIGFGLNEVAGDRDMGPVSSADCVPYPISELYPITTQFSKAGGYSPDDPNAAFWEEYFAETDLYLPAGDWEIRAEATFDAGDTCTAVPTQMTASITLTVEDNGEPSAEPTEPAELSVEPSAEPSGPEPEFTCDQVFGFAAEGSDFHPLIVADIRLGTHDGYDRIVFEYVDDGTPEFRLDQAETPFVMNPSGLPLTVDGSPVYSVTFIGAAKYDMETGEQPYTGSTDFTPGFEQIAQFVESGDFEAVHSWYLGTNGSTCLRAFTLTNPSRLVIDIQH
jgi:hypothetical protein